MKLTFEKSEKYYDYLKRQNRLACYERGFHMVKPVVKNFALPIDKTTHWGICECGEMFYCTKKTDEETNPYDKDITGVVFLLD